MEKIKSIIKALIFRHFKRRFSQLEGVNFIGSDYGGFFLRLSRVKDPIVLDVGVGKDLSFSEGICKINSGAEIYAIDPTLESKAWFDQSSYASCDNFRFYPYALSDNSGIKDFYAPEDESFVSHSLILSSNFSSKKKYSVRCVTINELIEILGLNRIDVLKLDIEGSEYNVLNSIESWDLKPKQICVEFHDRFFNLLFPRSKKINDKLFRMGYKVIGISKTFQEITYELIS